MRIAYLDQPAVTTMNDTPAIKSYVGLSNKSQIQINEFAILNAFTRNTKGHVYK